MNRYSRLFVGFVIVAALLGCMHKIVPPPTADDVAGPPSMPSLGVISERGRPAPVFGPPQEYAGIPLEAAKKSIRIQALIFSGGESGLHIADILKKKKAAGLDVRVIVDGETERGAAAAGGLNIANAYFRVDPSDPGNFWCDQNEPTDALYKLEKEFGGLFESML